MLSGFRGRQFELGLKVRVYRNLNNGLWSIKAREGEFNNKVIYHAKTLKLLAVRFIVSEAGRLRVKRDKSKNVHAYAEGIVSKLDLELTPDHINNVEVTYDPYLHGYFYARNDNASSVECADQLLFGLGKVYMS